MELKIIFSDYFQIPSSTLEKYGALDICLSSDLPLFIDPFLLFASEKSEYQTLHDKIVSHLVSLKNIAVDKKTSANTKLFQFPEIKQNWLGVCRYGNEGKGLGPVFARNIISAFNGFYANFGNETISSKSHIEKLTLVGKGIGRDFISDFTTNLILEYLLEYTESFAKKHLKPHQIKTFSVRCKFNAEFKTWMPRNFDLPYFYLEDGDFIILTPLDILTKDDAFICNSDLHASFRKIANSLENHTLRDAINDYFRQRLPINPKNDDVDRAITATINQFPEILDYYIRMKESEKDQAHAISEEKRAEIVSEFIPAIKALGDTIIAKRSEFYKIKSNSYSEALKRALFLKDVIENNDLYKIFYRKGKTAPEYFIQAIFRLTWFASPLDVNSEVNNGRGPADYKVSNGGNDATIVEFKLASSTSLERNLQNQTEIYKKASRAISDIKVILCYTVSEITRVKRVIKKITGSDAIPENIVIIDASPKKSASKV